MLEVRDRHFAFDESIPSVWHGDRRAVTAFFNNMSMFFPAGERFFIASVRAHRKFIRDPELSAAARDFCAQEGMHSREHAAYNRMLRAQGVPVDAFERRIEWALALAKRTMTPRMQLGVTCALEHFTALMGHLLLEDPRGLEGAHPTMAAVWRWHCAEEIEHKCVAFDVFQAAGGTYPERVWVMLTSTLMFWGLVLTHQSRLMKTDGRSHSMRDWGALFKYLFVNPGGMQRVILLYFTYFKPGFHPRDIPSDALLERWKGEQAATS